MEHQPPCRYRNDENCELMVRICYGAQLVQETGEYKVDFWTERTCPNYIAVETEKSEAEKTIRPVRAGDEVVIRIFGPMKVVEQCGDDCVAETVELQADILRGFFKRRYGDRVRVEGIDIASREVEDYPAVKEQVEKGAPVVVMINDEIKLVGDVDLGILKMEIEKLGLQEIK